MFTALNFGVACTGRALDEAAGKLKSKRLTSNALKGVHQRRKN